MCVTHKCGASYKQLKRTKYTFLSQHFDQTDIAITRSKATGFQETVATFLCDSSQVYARKTEFLIPGHTANYIILLSITQGKQYSQ